MDDVQLSAVFDALFWGQTLPGWSHQDYGAAQILISEDRVWARHVNDDGEAGPWVVLPPAA